MVVMNGLILVQTYEWLERIESKFVIEGQDLK